MLNCQEPINENLFEWPYPVDYDKENEVVTDVLILGGGIAGCHAAINAVRKGAKVAVVDKASVYRSGSGGAGVDHWHAACTSPCSKITPEEMVEVIQGDDKGITMEYGTGASFYILCKESYDTLLDVEKMGVKIRDVDDQFEGADFRDDETKLMFAYDYVNRYVIRVMGVGMKPTLFEECKNLGVDLYEHIMVTSLLTEDGKPGSKVVGATGVNVRTGEFYIFRAKAIILSSGPATGLWVFNTELVGSAAAALNRDPNCTGDGHAMAWRAGAEFMLMETGGRSSGGFVYPMYGTGNAHNTWYACSMVDANGKEIPWVDRDGNVLKTVAERYRPAPDQKFFFHGRFMPYKLQGPSLIPDLGEKIMKGEYVLPFFADLPGMPEHERRAIFGLMVAHEGKTRIPIYLNYTQAGFDPEKDMLQANVLPPMPAGEHMPYWVGMGPPQWRDVAFGGGGGVVFDWDLKTSVDGLFAAGTLLAAGGNHAQAATTGRYVGRKAAEYALTAADPEIVRNQVDDEKERIYAPVKTKDGIGWKELHAGICRIMQDYCGELKSEETLKMGLRWLESIRESEAAMVSARNPHELARSLECMSRITVGEMIMQASLARKASSRSLQFQRIDYPEVDPPEWKQFLTIKQEDGDVKVGKRPYNYWLLPPYAPSYKENYDKHCGL